MYIIKDKRETRAAWYEGFHRDAIKDTAPHGQSNHEKIRTLLINEQLISLCMSLFFFHFDSFRLWNFFLTDAYETKGFLSIILAIL